MDYTEINCPYCGAINRVESKPNTHIFPHPPIEARGSIGFRILSYVKRQDVKLSCLNCHDPVVITYLPNSVISKTSDESNYYMQLLNGQTPNNDNSLFVEKLLNFSRFNLIWGILLFLTIISSILYFYPRFFPLDNPQLSELPPFLAYILISILLIYFTKKFFIMLRTQSSLENLNLKLTKNYKKSAFGKAYEEWQIKSQIFSSPYSKISDSTIVGLFAVGMYLLIKFGVFGSLSVNVFAVTNYIPLPFTNNPVQDYPISTFLFWSEILSIPYNILVWFVFGNSFSIAIGAIINIDLLSLKRKFNEKILCEDEPNSSLPKIWFFCVGVIALGFFLITVVGYWASIASDAFSHMRTDPLSNIMGFISVIALFAMFTWILISPILRYRTKLIVTVNTCQNNLKKRLRYIERLYSPKTSDVVNYCKISNRITQLNSIDEWQIIFGKNKYKRYLIIISILTATGFITLIIPTIAVTIFQIIMKTFFSWI